MGNNLDLTSREWRDLIFEGKNKKYGAYYLRATSNKRHIKALIIVAASVIFLASLPFIFNFVSSILPEEEIRVTEAVIMDDLPPPEEEVIEEEIIPEIPVQELIEQVAYVAPVIADVEVRDDEVRQITEDLNETEAVISTVNVEGTTEVIPEELEELATEIVPEKPEIFEYVPEMPAFPGGAAALNKFLSEKLEYPRAELETGIQGTVVVQFTVSPSGALTDFKVVRKVSPGLDAEALRVAKLMPAWSPGRQNGKAVYVSFKLPVVFKFQVQN
ncbi:MAG: energy transducer TonB [Prevotellaceae bacterium]|jgi:protein TonB|nr:energy transducer TonB [Prevotellaceae bacterium]